MTLPKARALAKAWNATRPPHSLTVAEVHVDQTDTADKFVVFICSRETGALVCHLPEPRA